MLPTLKFILIFIYLEFLCWSGGMQDAFHLIAIDGEGQQLPKALNSARNENIPTFHEMNFRGQEDNHDHLFSADELVANHHQFLDFETNNFLLDNEFLFPFDQGDNFWSAAEGMTLHQDQPELTQNAGYKNLLTSPTDIYFDSLYDSHTIGSQPESIQHFDQTTSDLINHQSTSYPISYPFEIQNQAPQIAQSAILKSADDSSHSSFGASSGYLTHHLTHQVPATVDTLGLHQFEQSREKMNANLMPEIHPGNLNLKFGHTENAKGLNEETLQFSGPSYPILPSSDSVAAGTDTPSGRLMKTKDGNKNLAGTSKKRKKNALNEKFDVFESTEENRKRIIATLNEKFWVDYGEDPKLMSSKPIWRRFNPIKINPDDEKAADIRILNFGADFDKEAEEQIKQIKEEIVSLQIDEKKAKTKQTYITKRRLFSSIDSIMWDDNSDMIKKVLELTSEIDITSVKEADQFYTKRNIGELSVIATVFMKAISSFFSHHKNSNLFGNDLNIYQYLREIWKTSFSKTQDLRSFCQSMGEKSDLEIARCLSLGFKKDRGLKAVVDALKYEASKNDLKVMEKLRFSWDLVSVRFGVFYPEKTLRLSRAESYYSLINFIESALLYFMMKS